MKSSQTKKKSKQLLEIAKQGVEMAIEQDEKTAEAWIQEQIEQLGIEIDTENISLLPDLHIDKTAFSVASLSEESDEKAYWLSRTPEERLRHIETLRRINYGRQATARLQRVLEIAQGPKR